MEKIITGATRRRKTSPASREIAGRHDPTDDRLDLEQYPNGGKFLLCDNRGSAADAQHLAAGMSGAITDPSAGADG